MQEEDAAGSAQRRHRTFTRRSFHSPGPNYSWHADGYDKLKPYGLAIHGCVDGYSRRVMWLRVGYTNNDPAVIGYYYTQCLSAIGKCPQVLRTDCGTENGAMAAVQVLLHRNNASHRYGTSVANQRIECFWSQLRRTRVGFLIGNFKALVDNNELDLHDSTDIGCCRFAFMDYVQYELDAIRTYWNIHRIRHSRQQPSCGGVPDELYFLPENSQASECGTVLRPDCLAACHSFVTPPSSVSGQPQLDEYLKSVMTRLDLQKAWQWEGCVALYRRLRQIAHHGNPWNVLPRCPAPAIFPALTLPRGAWTMLLTKLPIAVYVGLL